MTRELFIECLMADIVKTDNKSVHGFKSNTPMGYRDIMKEIFDEKNVMKTPPQGYSRFLHSVLDYTKLCRDKEFMSQTFIDAIRKIDVATTYNLGCMTCDEKSIQFAGRYQ